MRSDLNRVNLRLSAVRLSSFVFFLRSLCCLRLIPIICPDPSVFAALREIFGSDECFSNSFST